jgi:hypothetical protein
MNTDKFIFFFLGLLASSFLWAEKFLLLSVEDQPIIKIHCVAETSPGRYQVRLKLECIDSYNEELNSSQRNRM